MVLNSKQVMECITVGKELAKAQQHGVDLTLKSVKDVFGGSVRKDKSTQYDEPSPYYPRAVFYENENSYTFVSGFFELRFEQGVKVPANVKANIVHRSSVLRAGGIITSGEYDPGFETDEMGAFILVSHPLILEKGARVAQLVMYEVNEGSELYNGQYQKR